MSAYIATRLNVCWIDGLDVVAVGQSPTVTVLDFLMSQGNLLNRVSAYYSDKLKAHGPTPKGVDWRDEDSQNLRFSQLVEVVTHRDRQQSISELGCGYGAFVTFLRGAGYSNDYVGTDISTDMVEAARYLHRSAAGARFECSGEPSEGDYVVASGIFNVKLDIDIGVWFEYVKDTLDLMFSRANRGIAFNCLTSYSDQERKRPDLFYVSPEEIMSWCFGRYGRHIALRHDYGLYEFTVIVRKDLS